MNIIRSDPDVKQVCAIAPFTLAKACELFVIEMTIRAWMVTILPTPRARNIITRADMVSALKKTEMCDFLVDILPREDKGGPGPHTTAEARTAHEIMQQQVDYHMLQCVNPEDTVPREDKGNPGPHTAAEAHAAMQQQTDYDIYEFLNAGDNWPEESPYRTPEEYDYLQLLGHSKGGDADQHAPSSISCWR